MICIGTDADDVFLKKLAEKYAEAGYATQVHNVSKTPSDIYFACDAARANGCNVFIAPIDDMGIIKYDLMIFIDKNKKKGIYPLTNIKEGGYLIINADDNAEFPFFIPNGVNIVTCGVNSKSALTFSGIDENINGIEKIQCCIQKGIRTFSGRFIEPQEFSVRVMGKYKISEVLAIIATAIMGDIEETVTSEELFFSK